MPHISLIGVLNARRTTFYHHPPGVYRNLASSDAVEAVTREFQPRHPIPGIRQVNRSHSSIDTTIVLQMTKKNSPAPQLAAVVLGRWKGAAMQLQPPHLLREAPRTLPGNSSEATNYSPISNPGALAQRLNPPERNFDHLLHSHALLCLGIAFSFIRPRHSHQPHTNRSSKDLRHNSLSSTLLTHLRPLHIAPKLPP